MAPQLVIAFPKNETELRVVYSEPVDRKGADDGASFTTQGGLPILSARVDPDDLCRVSLTTAPMNGEAMQVDVLRSPGVRSHSGQPLQRAESPPFIQGIASIPEIQRPSGPQFPFTSRFQG